MNISPEIIWFIIGSILIMLEFAVPGLIIIFFGLGAWVVSFACWLELTTTLEAQLGVFSVASLLFLFTLRKSLKARFTGHSSADQNPESDYEDFIGQQVIAEGAIEPGKIGKVRFRGTTWSALSEVSFDDGEVGKIKAVDNITLTISK